MTSYHADETSFTPSAKKTPNKSPITGRKEEGPQGAPPAVQRQRHNSVANVLTLQRIVGNQATQRLLAQRGVRDVRGVLIPRQEDQVTGFAAAAAPNCAVAGKFMTAGGGPVLSRAGASDAGVDAGTGGCPPKEKLDEIEKTDKELIKKSRGGGHAVAADNLQHFLDGSGRDRTLPASWLRSFKSLLAGEKKNQGRFESSLNSKANQIKHGEKKSFNDHWDAMVTASMSEELFYASGTSTVTSTGAFELSAIENVVSVSGSVKHHWHDPYDWNPGQTAYIPGVGVMKDNDQIALQNCRGAKPFVMTSDWTQTLNGTIKVGWLWNDKSFTWSGP